MQYLEPFDISASAECDKTNTITSNAWGKHTAMK